MEKSKSLYGISFYLDCNYLIKDMRKTLGIKKGAEPLFLF